MVLWNLVHGCHRKSEGCKHCYVFTRDEQHGIDANIVRKTSAFYLPMRRDRRGDWKIPRLYGDDVLLVGFLYRRNRRLEGGGLADDARAEGLGVLYGHQAS